MGFVKYFLVYSVCMAALSVVVHGANCVQCLDHSDCKDPVNTAAVGVTTCPLLDGFVCTRFSYKDSTGTLTSRTCVPKGNTCNFLKTANSLLMTDSDSWKCYTCNSDLCNKENGANSFGVPVASLVLAALVNLYFK